MDRGSSYSEASSISSIDCANSINASLQQQHQPATPIMNGKVVIPQIPSTNAPPAQQTASTISTSGFCEFFE
jgi:hypothetical protein